MSEQVAKLSTTNSNKIAKVVLTGGPCGGKTAAINYLQDILIARGYKVFSVPEASTLLQTNGAKYPGIIAGKDDTLLNYEIYLIELQMQLEDSIVGIASLLDHEKIVVLCDRGNMDVKAYVPTETWNNLLARIGMTELMLLSRYDLVCHLVTAAVGAEEFYTQANNTARIETSVEAKVIDEITVNCWKDHQQHLIIPNGPGGFNGKLEHLTNSVIDFLDNL